MTLTLGVTLLVVVAVLLALAVRLLRRPARAAVAVPELQEAVLPEPVLTQAEPEPAITWTVGLTETALDEAARLRLIDDLTLLAAPWTIALLQQAYREESSPQLRARIEAALAGCVLKTP